MIIAWENSLTERNVDNKAEVALISSIFKTGNNLASRSSVSISFSLLIFMVRVLILCDQVKHYVIEVIMQNIFDQSNEPNLVVQYRVHFESYHCICINKFRWI